MKTLATSITTSPATCAVLLWAAALGTGCNLEPSVKDQPTYQADVLPILEARCIRCHSYPPLEGATNGDRFDLFTCPTATDASAPCTNGAKDVAMGMSNRVQRANDAFGHMPPSPAAPLSPYQVDTIVKWAAESPPQ